MPFLEILEGKDFLHSLLVCKILRFIGRLFIGREILRVEANQTYCCFYYLKDDEFIYNKSSIKSK